MQKKVFFFRGIDKAEQSKEAENSVRVYHLLPPKVSAGEPKKREGQEEKN